MSHRNLRALVAIFAALYVFVQVPAAYAGTTGALNGVLTDAAGKRIPDAKVSAASPSQVATTTTDSAGRFSFVSLAPDTYSLVFQKAGFETGSQRGVTIQADQNLSVNESLSPTATTIGRVASRSADSLVRAGQTASEYSVTPGQIAAAAAIGGGTNNNSAFSAIASVPGVVVPLTNMGWGQSVFLRGGNYTQTGNEVDGVPINRSFDQYATSALSSLGNQEVQVYTGNAPADSQAVGLAGFVNQVIKTGTYPGTISAVLGTGVPALYNHFNFELSGATSNRLFSYYLATGGYSQQLRIVDQYNGQGFLARNGYGSLYNFVATGCGGANPSVGCYSNASPALGGIPYGPNGYAVGDTLWAYQGSNYDRESIANIHIGIPHKDGNKDDIQLLYNYGLSKNYPNSSMFSWNGQLSDVVNGTVNNGTIANGGCPALGGTYTGPAACQAGVAPFYVDFNRYTGMRNAPFTAANVNSGTLYTFPNSPPGHALGANVDFARQDGEVNSFAITKVQYQHAIGSAGYLRAYYYTLYSDRIDNGIVGLFQTYVGAFSPDYTISGHTKGAALTFGYEISPQNFLTVNGGYTTSVTSRYRDDTAALAGTSQVAYLVNSLNPAGGCYSGAGVLVSCTAASRAGYNIAGPNKLTGRCAQVLCPRDATSPIVGTESSITCGTGPCQYYAVNDGTLGALNTVVPKFFNASIGDSFKPNSRLTLDASLRLDSFSYIMQPTNTIGNQLLVNSYNSTHCITGTTISTRAIGAACSAGTTPTALTADSTNLTFAGQLQPRFGASYLAGSNDVFRASYGRFIQAPETSSVQATNVQAGTPSAAFYSQFGFNGFSRVINPEVSYNLDFSWAHQFKDSDVSSRITPFLRKTKDEFATIVVDPKTNFSANVNGENLTASGFEFALNKGDFNRDGLAARFAFTYTWDSSRYKVYPTGGSFVSGANTTIVNYNQYTKYCGSNPSSKLCSDPNSNGVTAAPCYAAGVADPTCAVAGTVANPYYNSPVQALLDPNASYPSYNGNIANSGGTSTSYNTPYVASLILQYKSGPLKIIPTMQFFAGARYGTPFSEGGVAPDTCSALAGATTVGDPRYAGGATAGAAYDASSCTGAINIPNRATGTFDGIGSYVQPNLLDISLQVSYELSKHLTLQLTAANIYANCWGGSNVPWAIGGRQGCGYTSALAVGNFYNPGDSIQQGFRYPYAPSFGGALQGQAQQGLNPPQLFMELQFKGF